MQAVVPLQAVVQGRLLPVLSVQELPLRVPGQLPALLQERVSLQRLPLRFALPVSWPVKHLP